MPINTTFDETITFDMLKDLDKTQQPCAWYGKHDHRLVLGTVPFLDNDTSGEAQAHLEE